MYPLSILQFIYQFYPSKAKKKKKITGCQGLKVEAGINRGSTEDFQGSENIVCDTAMCP